MTWPTAAEILPDDAESATLVGRAWVPALSGPSVVVLRETEVVEPDGLLARARELGAVIASRPPIAAETAKANLRAAFNMTQDESIRYERDLQTITFATADADEGRAAFAEKRAGVFHRR